MSTFALRMECNGLDMENFSIGDLTVYYPFLSSKTVKWCRDE